MKLPMIISLITTVILATAIAQESIEQKVSESSKPGLPPLKFQIDRNGQVVDAPGSDLIMQYKHCVGQIQSAFGGIIDDWHAKETVVKAQLASLKEDGETYAGTKFYLMDIQEKIQKYVSRRKNLLEHELILDNLLTEIHIGSPLSDEACSHSSVVPNYDFLVATPFKDLPLLQIFTHYYLVTVDKQIRDSSHTFLRIKYPISIDLQSQLTSNFMENDFGFQRLVKIQERLRKIGKIIYHLSNGLEMSVNLVLEFSALQQSKSLEETDIDLLNRKMNDLLFKAEHRTTPMLAPYHRFAEIIMAFQEEAMRHKPAEKA